MAKRLIIMIVCLIIVFGIIFGIGIFKEHMINKYMSEFVPPPATVSAATVKEDTWKPFLYAIGSLEAYNGVELSPQQSGVITNIMFKSGDIVKKGTPLVQQNIAEDEQDLKNYEAQLVLAKADYNRYYQLMKTGYVSRSDFDQRKAKLQETQANVDKTKVIISQKTIRAPFDGKLGIRKVNVGQYTKPGDNVVNIQQVNPLRILFYLPQQDLSSLKNGQQVIATLPNDPDKTQYKGTITAIGPSVDADTRNITIQANIPNDKMALRPGMYMNVNVSLPTQKQVVTVPQTAITYNLYGDSVYVIHNTSEKIKGKTVKGLFVHETFVTLGEMRGGEVAVTHGLKAGDQVVTSGQTKLRNGAQVVISKKSTISAAPYIKNTGPA